jgi:hypothetical protein
LPLVLLLGFTMNLAGLTTLARHLRGFIADWSKLAWNPPAEFRAELVSRGWMRRVVDVTTPEGIYIVEYLGSGLGYERILVDGAVVAQATAHTTIIVPQFEFLLGPRRCTLHVTGWPWLTLRSLVLALDGEVIYREGF